MSSHFFNLIFKSLKDPHMKVLNEWMVFKNGFFKWLFAISPVTLIKIIYSANSEEQV